MASTDFFILILILIVIGFWWSGVRCKQMLDRWASDNGYTLLESHYVFFSFSLFYLMSARGQMVYRVTVLDGRGHELTGMARCGSWLWGVWQDKVTVKWDS